MAKVFEMKDETKRLKDSEIPQLYKEPRRHWKKYIVFRRDKEERRDSNGEHEEVTEISKPVRHHRHHVNIEFLLMTSESGKVTLHLLERLNIFKSMKEFKKKVARFLDMDFDELVFISIHGAVKDETPEMLSLKDRDVIYVLWKRRVSRNLICGFSILNSQDPSFTLYQMIVDYKKFMCYIRAIEAENHSNFHVYLPSFYLRKALKSK